VDLIALLLHARGFQQGDAVAGFGIGDADDGPAFGVLLSGFELARARLLEFPMAL